ncbi:MAG: type III-A CRISPR-associated protein Csm2 [Flavobacteriales bacterium]|nr:type III-A CRISPR-associated protein Csm2 [Flavobacteriales bacterium]
MTQKSSHGSTFADRSKMDKGPESNFKVKPEWIEKKLDYEAIQMAEKLGKFLKEKKFTMNQIRNFFGEVKRIQMKDINKEETAFLLLKPKLAYAAHRANNEGAQVFKNVMTQAWEAVLKNGQVQPTHFKNFVDFLEAVLAYHKAS